MDDVIPLKARRPSTTDYDRAMALRVEKLRVARDIDIVEVCRHLNIAPVVWSMKARCSNAVFTYAELCSLAKFLDAPKGWMDS